MTPYIPSDKDNLKVIHAKFAFDQFLEDMGLVEVVQVDTLDFRKYYRDHAGDLFAVDLDMRFRSHMAFKDQAEFEDFGEHVLEAVMDADTDKSEADNFARIAMGVTAEIIFKVYYEMRMAS